MRRYKGGRVGRGLWATRGIAAKERLCRGRRVLMMSSLLLKAGFKRLCAEELVVTVGPVPHESSHSFVALPPYSLTRGQGWRAFLRGRSSKQPVG
jgi:hypothetical protein